MTEVPPYQSALKRKEIQKYTITWINLHYAKSNNPGTKK